MTQKLLSFLFALVILACPLNCMPAGAESAETVSISCCSHCQSQTSNDAPLAPEHSPADCCQCFCYGAIHDKASQVDLSAMTFFWMMPVLSETESLFIPAHQSLELVSSAPPPPAGRALRCAQMSFLC
ncbi:hypothetical protein [Gimesia panareensis]|uniref:hypothetical protein n=1 Tax=Gimesia panareensis TaxID=2527978 RepID=UPI001188EE34|nr:hypothetical protein [Gimesia panareensis]QDU50824.1 hypothetical protein Pan110_31840 [Gimesia panareensis]